jgi:hypothetical protein
MIAVAVLAIPTWLVIAAVRVARNSPEAYLHHFWRVNWGYGTHDGPATQCRAPFWPRYRRAVLGQQWPGTYHCHCVADDGERASWGNEFRLSGTKAGIEGFEALLDWEHAHQARIK